MSNKLSFANPHRDDEHYAKLKKLVKDRLDSLPKVPVIQMRIKALSLMLLYFLLYAAALSFSHNSIAFLTLYSLMGVSIVLIFLNVIHEAIHGTLFKRKILNQLSVHFLDVIGANSYIFRKRHINLHHNFPNVEGWDSDIEQASLLRIFPNSEQKRVHRIQHRTFCLLYPIYLVNWVFVRDFKDYFLKKQVVRKICMNIPRSEYVKLFVFKGVFIFYTIGVPLLLGVQIAHAVAALLVMLIVAGTFALVVLLTPHVNVQNEFPLPEKDNKLSGGWFLHQLNTTNDVSCNNWLSRNVMANFNCHLAHHLFPHISYVYAPHVTAVIREYTTVHHLNYRSYPLAKALLYHYQLLKENAKLAEILEEDM